METLFSLLILAIIVFLGMYMLVWLLGHVTIISDPIKQLIISGVALVLVVMLIGMGMGVIPLPHVR